MTAGLEEPDSPPQVARLPLPAAEATDTRLGVSPMATGPAGPWLEAHVGAQYLLPLLQSGDPRGMPGMRVTSVQFQRAGMGSPLDDVIVLGHDAKGTEVRLQVQVKRSIEFTLGDPNFRSVVAMACRATAADIESRDWSEPSSVTFKFDDRGGGLWLALAAELWAEPAVASRLRSLLDHCWPWTAGANGVGMSDEEAGERAREWSGAYFSAAVKAAVTLEGQAWQDLLFDRVQELPDDAFLNACESVLLQIDILWIDEDRLSDSQVLHARQLIVDRLRATRSWKLLVPTPSHSIDTKIAGGLATVFVGTYQMSRGPKCYLPAVQGHRASPLLPLLTELAQEGAASTFVAMGFLGLIEVAPRLDYLPFLWTTTSAWWKRHGTNPGFWHDHGVGGRVCAWVDTVLSQPDAALPPHRDALIGISDTLLKCGITQAKPLEDQILELLRRS